MQKALCVICGSPVLGLTCRMLVPVRRVQPSGGGEVSAIVGAPGLVTRRFGSGWEGRPELATNPPAPGWQTGLSWGDPSSGETLGSVDEPPFRAAITPSSALVSHFRHLPVTPIPRPQCAAVGKRWPLSLCSSNLRTMLADTL